MKVVQVIHGLNMGGAETLVKDYAIGLKKIGVDVAVLCLEHISSPYEEMLQQQGIPVVFACDDFELKFRKNIVTRVLNRLLLYRAIHRQIIKLKPDLIHIHLSVNDFIRHAHIPKNVAVVYTQHYSVEQWKESNLSEIKKMRWIMKHYNTQLIALNDEMKTEMDDLFGISDTIVLNNGTNLARFRDVKPKKQVRMELGIPENALVIGHVGRFSKVKNHTFLVQVFDEIKKKEENAVLILIGVGETEKMVHQQVEELHLENSVFFLRNRTDVADLMHAMDLMIMPSFSEGLGIAVIEAQAAGIHCLASSQVPEATKISNYITYMGLEKEAKVWAEKAMELAKKNCPIVYQGIEEWDMDAIIKKLEAVYAEQLRK